MRETKIETENQKFTAEIADNFFSRMKGLSFRSEGKMLFKFSHNTTAKIDMMLLSKPLHLYFMNSSGEIIDVQKAKPWSFDPRTWKLYSPGRPYRYLLESFEDLGAEEGDFMKFEGSE